MIQFEAKVGSLFIFWFTFYHNWFYNYLKSWAENCCTCVWSKKGPFSVQASLLL